jgi:hypothetical protein
MNPSWLDSLQELLEKQCSVQALHPLLARSYPVAIAQAGMFFLFDTPDLATPYQLAIQAPVPMPIPEGVRAAFPLDFYGGRPACVVTAEVFDRPEGFAILLHEFAHCFQWQTCEPALRQELAIARKAQEAGDFMWEINYPFPYADPDFTQVYTTFLLILPDALPEEIKALRANLKEMLSPDDYEYLTWQEWKEGFARWLENRIRAAWGLEQILRAPAQPMDRVVFYAGGAAYIEHLEREAPSLPEDLTQLNRRIVSG